MLDVVGASTRVFIARSHTLSLSNHLPRFEDGVHCGVIRSESQEEW